jgi:hypothetical protein
MVEYTAALGIPVVAMLVSMLAIGSWLQTAWGDEQHADWMLVDRTGVDIADNGGSSGGSGSGGGRSGIGMEAQTALLWSRLPPEEQSRIAVYCDSQFAHDEAKLLFCIEIVTKALYLHSARQN